MTFSTKFGLFTLIIGAVGMMNATTTFAADASCVRIPVGQWSSILYHDYHLATQRLTTQTYDDPQPFTVVVDSFPEDGSAVVVLRTFDTPEHNIDVLRFIDGVTQSVRDVPLNDIMEPSQLSHGSGTGWSPNGQYYAIGVNASDSTPGSLNIFTRTGDLVATTPYESMSSPALWIWSPQSDRIAITQAVSSTQVEGDTLPMGASILTVSGELIPIDLVELQDMPYIVPPVVTWSPDGRSLMLRDSNILQIANPTTGEAVLLSKSHYFELADDSEMMWTSDSRFFLYLSKSHYDEDATLVLLRYNAETGKTTELLDFVVPTFDFSPPTAGKNQRYMVGTVQGDASKSVLVDGITGEVRTLAQGQDYYEWSPTGDSLLAYGATGVVLVSLEADDAFQFPAGWIRSIAWSPNGEWVGFSSEGETGGYTLWLMNARTGESRAIVTSENYVEISPTDQGAAFIREDTNLSVVTPGGSDPVLLTDNAQQFFDVNAPYGLYWSPDGSIGIFGERPAEDATLHFVQSDGTVLDEVVVPLEGVPYGSLQWVGCDS